MQHSLYHGVGWRRRYVWSGGESTFGRRATADQHLRTGMPQTVSSVSDVWFASEGYWGHIPDPCHSIPQTYRLLRWVPSLSNPCASTWSTTVHSLMQEESTHARHQRQPEWPVTTMPEYKMDKFWSWIDFCQHDIWAWSGNGAGRWDDLSRKVVLAAQSSLGWFVLQWNYQINFCRLELRPIGGGQDRLASSSQLLLQQLFNPRHHLSTTPHPIPSRSAARNTDNCGPKIVHL